jgi:hypothetical protein
MPDGMAGVPPGMQAPICPFSVGADQQARVIGATGSGGDG